MDATAMRRRILEARVARLATVDAEGRPHIVPISFALDGDTMFFAVDMKPKRTTNLKRLRNIAANPAVAVLFDHYEDDWSRLWWVRLRGPARIVEDRRAMDLLAAKYPQYRAMGLSREAGLMIKVDPARVTRWQFAPPDGHASPGEA